MHSGIADVHATGHAQADELKTYLSIAQPEWFVPIHGEFRHLVANARLGELMGVAARPRAACARTATCSSSPTTGVEMAGRVPAGYLYVDGIVGDVGQGVLRDRRVLAEEGVVVVVVTVDIADRQGAHRTGDHHPRLGLRAGGRGPARRGVRHDRRGGRGGRSPTGVRDVEALERDVRRAAGKFVSERTRRRPMIVPVVMEA